ncbi:pseudouridine synthase [Lipomyces arxii]|uniref:pseudouridine synthase n=1 Tax=Lipomyces arxii TaxID=56418 RepID=UPI0034CF5C93
MSEIDQPPSKRTKLHIESSIGNSNNITASAQVATEGKVTEANVNTDHNDLTETDVGITQYLGSHSGFRGVLKQRYTDFLVHEILESGEVLHIKRIPVQSSTGPRDKIVAKEEPLVSEDREQFQPDPTLEARISSTFGKDCVTKLQDIIKQGGHYKSDLVFDDKDERGQIHRLVRDVYGGLIDTKTTENNMFWFSQAKNFYSRKTSDRRHKKNPSSLLDPVVQQLAGTRDVFTHFSIYKENKESQEVCRLITKFLRKKPNSVSVAGTKDRRGVTVQRASIEQTPIERLVSLNKAFRDIILTDFVYQKNRIKLGDLQGNQFVITIRDIEHPDGLDLAEEAVSRSLTSLQQTGFINYFGMQRFGTHSVSTHVVGLELLRSNYREAANLILSPQPFALPDSIPAREQYAHNPTDISAALKLMPRSCNAEFCILSALNQASNDWLGAIMHIPRNLRTMYVHAYQSFVWNSVVSYRIQKYGLQLVEGDLLIDVAIKEQKTQNDITPTEDDFEEDVIDTTGAKYVKVRPITAAEIEQGKFTVFDIVMPTPGFGIVYPEHSDLRQAYETIMQSDGMDPYNMRHNVKDFSLPGSYRSILSMPKDVSFQCYRHADLLQQFVRTDTDIISAREKGGSKDVLQELCQEEVPVGEHLSVVLKMKLGASQYATMALREAMRLSTSRRGDMLDMRIFGSRNGTLI